MPHPYTSLTANPHVMALLHTQQVIGFIETRRDSHGSHDGGVVAYRQANYDPTDTRERYAVHYYHVENGKAWLAVGDYDLTREQAMERLLERSKMQGQGMWHPCLG